MQADRHLFKEGGLPPGNEVLVMNVHEGHRQRLKKRFLENGLDSFDDHTVLELLLFYAQPRKDTNPIAHELLNHFGSLDAVFEATTEELSSVDGLGDNTAALIKLVPATFRRYLTAKARDYEIIENSKMAGEILVPYYLMERDEVVRVMCLDAKNKLICCRELFRGAVNSTDISIRKIAELALAKNATGIIIAHNHPSGIALPSVEDETTTKRLKAALENMGIILIDHIVVAGDDFVSMADSGII